MSDKAELENNYPQKPDIDINSYHPLNEDEFLPLDMFPTPSDNPDNTPVYGRNNFSWTINTTPRGVVVYNFCHTDNPSATFQAQFAFHHHLTGVAHSWISNLDPEIPENNTAITRFGNFFENDFLPFYSSVIKDYLYNNGQN